MPNDEELQRLARERDLAAERFVLMCTAMNQCMWDWDIRTNVAWYSDAIYGVYGIDPTVTPSFERWTTYVHPDDRERVVAGFRSVVETGGDRWAEEYRFVRPNDGKVLEVFDRGFVMFEAGQPVRMVGVVMDVTQQRTLERQLRHAQKMQAIGQLAGGVAHDFNNILQAARLELDLLLRVAPPESDKLRAHARELGATLERSASLTHQLLMFSRLEAMRVEAIDLNAKIGELAKMLRRLLGASVTLDLELARDVMVVDADASMIDQVLVNLAVNARDAMANAGSLAIATTRCDDVPPGRPQGRYVRIDVRDSGAGISSDVLPRIFDPFFTTKPTGTGLGLATAYGIIEQHRGWIDVDSEVGRGTTFSVYLPERTAAVVHAPSAPAATSPRGTEKILLVEDDCTVRRALSQLLQGHGYHVLATDSGAAALAAWETAGGEIDLVVTDLMMAGMNGRELAAALVERKPEVPILMISGNRAIDPPVPYELLHKPFDGDSLLAAVRACLDH